MNDNPDFTEIAQFQLKQKVAWYKLLDPVTKYLLYGGSMAGGKSYLLRWACVGLLMYYYKKYKIPNVTVGLFSEDYPTLKDRQISKMSREFPAWLGHIKEDKIDGLSFQLRPKWGGGRVLLRNLDDPSKYMSTEFAAEFMEESTRNNQQTFEDLRNRLRYPGIEEVKFLAASNPGGIGHGWNKKYFVDNDIPNDPEKERFFYIHANAYDNKFISPNYIKQLESLPEQQRKAYLEGSWDIFAGQYYPEFSIEKHVVDSFIPKKDNFYYFIGGMDWGRENPFSLHITGIQKKENEGVVFYRAFTFLELYGTQKSPKEWGEEIKKMLEFYDMTLDDIRFIQCDNQIFNKGLDNGKSIHLQFCDSDERYKTLLKPAPKDRIAGWENMHDWLSLAPDNAPYWVMTKNCKNLIRTLPQAIHDEIKMEDIDDKGEVHALDDQRYQFSAIKWIDAKVGGVGVTKTKQELPVAIMKDGRQVAVDIGKFSTAWDKANRHTYYK